MPPFPPVCYDKDTVRGCLSPRSGGPREEGKLAVVITKKFDNVSQLQDLQRLACSVPEAVFIHSMDDTTIVDAKSFINLFTLDFSQTVKIVTTSERVLEALK